MTRARRSFFHGVFPALFLGMLLSVSAISAQSQSPIRSAVGEAPSEESEHARHILSRPEYSGYDIVSRRHPESDHSEAAMPGAEGRWREDEPERHYRADRARSDSAEPAASPMIDGLGLGSISLEGVAWAMVLVLAAAALIVVVRVILDVLSRPKRKKSPKATLSNVTSESAPDHPVNERETLEASLRREYEAALAARDYANATLLRFKLFWLAVGWQGWRERDDVRTWRDALTLLPAEGTRPRVRRLLNTVEAIRYGAYHPNERAFTQWLDNLEQIGA